MTRQESSTVLVAGRRIHYVAQGQGRALVLVHGLAGWSFSWRHNLGPLSRHFRVYALDLPGCGLSDPGLLTMEEAAQVVAGFVTAMGESRAHLLGTSTGGASAALCALNSPELVEKLVLVAPVNPFSRNHRAAIHLGGTAAGEVILRAAQLAGPWLAGILLRRRLYARPERVSKETVEGYARPLARPSLPAELRRVYRDWQAPPAEAWSRIAQPVLLIWGERDRTVPPGSGRKLAAALKAELEVLPACGHLPYEEEPEIFNKTVTGFLL